MPDPGQIRFVDLHAQRAVISDRIDAAIARVLDHGRFIMGPEVAALETALSDYTGAAQAVSCSSGTDALLMALMALGVGPGDAILCPDFTYTATPETIALLGAVPVFLDVNAECYNLEPGGLEAGLTAAREAGLTPRGLIAVDLFGLPADYDRIGPWAKENGLFVLSDGAQAFGARYGNRVAGRFATVTATSFFPAKPLGCYGDGGAVFTEDAGLADTLRSIRSHGQAIGGGKYDIERVGINGRLDTIQAAILLEKLQIYDHELAQRQDIAACYMAGLDAAFGLPIVPTATQSAWAQFTIRVPDGKRDALKAHLAEAGVPTMIYYPRPLHQQSAYAHFPRALDTDPVSARLSRAALSLPVHPYLTEAQVDHIIAAVNNFSTTTACSHSSAR